MAKKKAAKKPAKKKAPKATTPKMPEDSGMPSIGM